MNVSFSPRLIRCEIPIVGRCSICHEPLFPGDQYALFTNDERLCEICIEEMTPRQVAEFFGGLWKTAEMEDAYDGYDG